MTPRVTAVVLAYRPEPWLERCIPALLASEGVDADVVLVDNGGTEGLVDRFRATPGVTVVGDGENLGFSGGCNLGASVATGDHLALVNGDLVVAPDTLARLVAVAADPSVGIAAGSVRLGDDPDLLNTSGNEIHFLGFSWVGGFGEPAATHALDRDVAGAMGALCAMRREVWDALGGFAPEYFAFHEDADLSWRCWQHGWRVHYVPDAVGLHRYEFDREPRKMYLAERNRWIFVLTCWDGRTLALLAPVLVAMEAAVALMAWRGGWLRDKVRGWRWLWGHRRWLRERRAEVQGARTVGDRRLARLMAHRMDARNFPIPDALRPLDAALGAYWRAIRPLLPGDPRRASVTAASGPSTDPGPDALATARPEYAARLAGLQGARWKRVLDVQAPYRRFLRSLSLGRTLDVGCGIGRNLGNLGPGAVGVDHNAEAVATCRDLGFEAYTTAEFEASGVATPASFDALLFSHVLEHMTRAEAVDLVRGYLPYLRPGGRVVMITPQERGFASDATHVELMDFDALGAVTDGCGMTVERARSFPFPRTAGRWFTYNEFVVVAVAP